MNDLNNQHAVALMMNRKVDRITVNGQKDCNVKHYTAPKDTSMRIVCVKGYGRSITTKRGFYEVQHGVWYLAGGDTTCKPLWWSYLIEAE